MYEYTSTQVVLRNPDTTIQGDANFFDNIQADITPDKLYRSSTGPKGLEEDPHITVLYGIDVEPEKASETFNLLDDVLSEFENIKATIGEIKKFTGTDKDTDLNYDVIYLEIISPDLVTLNSEIKRIFSESNIPVVTTHPEYTPHMTLAYVTSGSCDNLLGSHPFVGVEVIFKSVEMSVKDGKSIIKEVGDMIKLSDLNPLFKSSGVTESMFSTSKELGSMLKCSFIKESALNFERVFKFISENPELYERLITKANAARKYMKGIPDETFQKIKGLGMMKNSAWADAVGKFKTLGDTGFSSLSSAISARNAATRGTPQYNQAQEIINRAYGKAPTAPTAPTAPAGTPVTTSPTGTGNFGVIVNPSGVPLQPPVVPETPVQDFGTIVDARGNKVAGLTSTLMSKMAGIDWEEVDLYNKYPFSMAGGSILGAGAGALTALISKGLLRKNISQRLDTLNLAQQLGLLTAGGAVGGSAAGAAVHALDNLFQGVSTAGFPHSSN